MPNPYVLLGGILALAISFGAGWTVHGWKYDAARTSALTDALKAQQDNYANAVAVEAKRIAANRETDAKTETVIQKVTKYVREDPAYCGLRADGIGLLNSLRTGHPLPATGKPDGTSAAAPAP